MLEDITFKAYQRANQLRPQLWPEITENRYSELFTYAAPDVSRTDNQVLALATMNLANAFAAINEQYPGSDTLRKMLLRLLMKFAGEQQDDDVLQTIMDEAGPANPQQRPMAPVAQPNPPGRSEEPQENKVKQNGYH